MVKKFKTFGPQLVFAEQAAGSVVVLTNEQKLSIYKKSQKSGISTDILEEVYRRGYSIWNESFGQTVEQFAFDRVNSFIAGGFAADLDNDLMEKRGLWDNIHAKRARIKAGSGEHMRKPGSKGAPTEAALKASQNEEAEIDEACWTGYKKVGMKKKGDRMVPNCVPVKEAANPAQQAAIAIAMKKAGKKPKEIEEALTAHKGKHFKTSETVEKQSRNSNDSDSRFDGTKSAKNVYQKETPGQPITEAEVKGDSVGALASRGKILDDLIAKQKEAQDKPATSVGQASERRQFNSAGEVKSMTDPTSGAKVSTTIPNQAVVKKQPAMTNALTTIKRVVKESYICENCNCGLQEEILNERGADAKGYYRSTESGAGLTAKGAKHFGIKTAVTTPPSKLKPGSKAANRRKSFCARMGGMKGPMKDEKGRPTRKAMSLRRWHC